MGAEVVGGAIAERVAAAEPLQQAEDAVEEVGGAVSEQESATHSSFSPT